MYKLIYSSGQAVLIDTFSRKDAALVRDDECKRTGQGILLQPWEAFPDRSELTYLCRCWYGKLDRWVEFYECPEEV